MIRRFDVVRNPRADLRPAVPYLVVLQSHFLPDFPTLVVAPLRLASASEGLPGLQTPVTFDDDAYAVMITELAHLPRKPLGAAVGNLEAFEFEIARALDRLFTGF